MVRFPATSQGCTAEMEKCILELGQTFQAIIYITLQFPISVILYRGACFLWVLPEFMHDHTTTKVHFYFLYFSYRKSSYFMNYSVACLAIYPGEWRCVSLMFGKGLPSFLKPPLVWTEAILALTHIHVRTRGDPASLPGDP